ncbi:MAG: hypothetical protein MZV63_18835 [Marinilabiliales bacterium]|nr:hypothetical protein [Marinilabiliales bacterium]
MDLISLVIFIFCAAMAAGSILLLTRLLEERPAPFVRSLFYHNIFISAFGFYGIWGQFIIVALAGSRLSPDTFSTVSVISLLLGLPFLVFGWMMILRFAAESSRVPVQELPHPLIPACKFRDHNRTGIYIKGYGL